ncbi:hypothetical protein SAMN05421640_0708 [Ekhidna lutea]|uniref:Septum formation inhibitor Maf n=1 Tax=Ekhidna lutea TaxID=447679 RepID=A0A239FJN4_EKHLU|nr:hypothetical protein [Ekhidna lutea]SNS57149.1 hypothetical protein SAMN05421640_0708 [Ekhidna lutea]
MKQLIFSVLILSLVACVPSNSQETKDGKKIVEKPTDFNDYWYAGEAEITSYSLEQARYGEIHKGEAVMVFVTEPFSKSKQVKLDDWRDESADNVSVMKLNMTKKFLTGIYPYSMMMSTFTPVSYDQYPDPFKVTTSSQEWCGHTFMQLNLKKESYMLNGYSYFESEGDVVKAISKVPLEDEFWSRIRFNPETLPIGKLELLPSTFYLRLRHQESRPQTAIASKLKVHTSEFSDEPHHIYTLEYENRKLSIYYEPNFPFTILGWEETYMSGFGEPELLTTKAKRINSIKSAYWGKNSNKDREIREELGLSIK